jgi:HK97 family phage major capsid protein
VSDLDRLGVRALGADSAQQRALSTVAAPGFVPPTWMLEAWATVSRAACPLRKLATKLPLPDGTLELHIPRFTSAAGVVPMSFQNVDPPDDYAGTDSLIAPVCTIAGDGAISQQLYDRGPGFSDEIALADFADSYGESLQQQLIGGTGQNGQILGLMNVSHLAVDGVPGSRLVTYTTAEPTVPGLVKAVAQCAGQISDTRKRAPSAILMHGARFFDIAGSEDKNGEPVLRPGTGTVPSDESGPYGPLCNLPVYFDEAGIPTDLETNQDAIVLARTRDILLLEEDRPRFSAMAATSDAGELTVILQFHQYVAAFTNRYPSGIGQVRGTGLTVPAGF